MGRVVRARREIEKERLVGRDLLQVGDEVDRLVGKIGGEVVALFRRLWRLDLMIVVDEIGIILMGVAAEKPVIALEAAPQRPAVIRTGRADLLGWRQVPFADGIGRITLLQQRLRQKPVLEGYRAIAAGIAGRSLGDARHRVRVMVAPGQDARARWRTERRRVHVVEQETVLGELVDVRRRDRRAEAAELAEAGVIDDDEENVRRALFGAKRRRPGRLGFANRAAHAAGECRARLIFLERHAASPSHRDLFETHRHREDRQASVYSYPLALTGDILPAKSIAACDRGDGGAQAFMNGACSARSACPRRSFAVQDWCQ